MMPLVRISEDLKERLVELQGKLQAMLGKRVSLGETIAFLITGSVHPLITEEDNEYLARMKRGDLRKYANALLMNYCVLYHLSWSDANNIIRKKCGADVDGGGKKELECAISFLEGEVFKKTR